jgi:predicted O-methyltransferase YrrM
MTPEAADDAGQPTLAERLTDYASRLYAEEDAVLRDLRAETGRRGMPAINVSADEGKLLQLLVRIVDARRVLEIGTLGGYSAIWMARALPAGGRLVTLEIDPAHADVARAAADRAGLADVIDVRVGAATDLLPALAGEEPFDVCFIDADKRGYPAYLDWALRLVRPGGLILGDNTHRDGRILEDPPGDDDTRAMQEFNRRLATDPRLDATMIPIRDGLGVALVLGTTEGGS